jgi:hypothetical protein
MNDPTDARSKAEASHRLAELAKTPRARELFRQLAEEYESRARGELGVELIGQAEAAPSLVPIAPLVSADEPAPDEAPAPVVAAVLLAPAAPSAAPMSAPMVDTTQWLSNLAAIRVVS